MKKPPAKPVTAPVQRRVARRKPRAGGPFEPDQRLAQQLVLKMLSIPGGSGREGRVVEFVRAKLRGAGVPQDFIRADQAHRRSPQGGDVGNLACVLPGTFRAPRRLLMAHLDTVPLCQHAVPLVRGKRIVPADKKTALGADDRAGAAVVLSTALDILRRRLAHPPLTFFWTVQEEVGLLGARYARLAMLGKPRLAFNFDGGAPDKVTVGATGGYRLQIHVDGMASHAGGAPEDGVSAITVASLAISQLHREGWLGQVHKRGPSGTSNVGVIRGGQATNVVTPHVDVLAEARSHDPAFRARIVRTIERAFRKAARSVRNREGVCGRVRFAGHPAYEAFKLPDGDPSTLVAEAAIRSAGLEPARAISNGGLDANWLTARGIPTVSLGCGQEKPHTVSEKLNLVQFSQACRIALRLATATEDSPQVAG